MSETGNPTESKNQRWWPNQIERLIQYNGLPIYAKWHLPGDQVLGVKLCTIRYVSPIDTRTAIVTLASVPPTEKSEEVPIGICSFTPNGNTIYGKSLTIGSRDIYDPIKIDAVVNNYERGLSDEYVLPEALELLKSCNPSRSGVGWQGPFETDYAFEIAPSLRNKGIGQQFWFTIIALFEAMDIGMVKIGDDHTIRYSKGKPTTFYSAGIVPHEINTIANGDTYLWPRLNSAAQQMVSQMFADQKILKL